MATLVTASAARADKAERCIAASELGQQQRDRGALIEARASFRTCAADDCATMIRKDCARWLEDVQEGLPTVVVGARDARGADVLGVRVFVDGEPIAEAESGRAIALDPGPHLFRFEKAPSAPIEQTVVLRMGEHNRAILATFEAPAPVAPPKPTEEKTAPRPVSTTHVSPWAYAAGGVGIVGLGAFTYFGISGLNEKSRVRALCSPACTDDQVSGVRNRYLAADISLGVGLVALAVSAYLFLNPTHDAPTTTVSVAPTRGGAMLGVLRSF